MLSSRRASAKLSPCLGKVNPTRKLRARLTCLKARSSCTLGESLRKLGVRNRTEAVLAAVHGGYLSKGTFGVEAPMSGRNTADADHKIPIARAQKICAQDDSEAMLGWCSFSASFDPYEKPAPERHLIKWGIMTTRGVLVCNKALSPSTMPQRSPMPYIVQLRQRDVMDHQVAVVGDELERHRASDGTSNRKLPELRQAGA